MPPETKPASTQLQDLHNSLVSSLPSSAQSHPLFNQMQALANSQHLQDDPGSLAQLQTLYSQLSSINPAALDVGARVKEQLGNEISFTAVNASSGQTEEIKVPVTGVSVHPEMSAGNEQLVVRVHVPDTTYEADIAKKVAPVVAGLHPDFQPNEQNAAPVHAGSYRDDTSVSLVADIPKGKTYNQVVAEILHPELGKPAPAQQDTPAVVAIDASSQELVNKGPVAAGDLSTATTAVNKGGIAGAEGHSGDVIVNNTVTAIAGGGDDARTFASGITRKEPPAAGAILPETVAAQKDERLAVVGA